MDSLPHKVCTKCGLLKPLSDYQKRKSSKDGHAFHCKACQRAYDQRPERRARQNELERARYANDLAHREKEKAKVRRIYATNEKYREATKARAGIWDKVNADRRNAQTRRRYKAYHHIKDRQRKHKRRSILKEAGSFTAQEWRELCKRFKGCCARCGKKCKPTVDHIVPLSKGGSNTIDNIQPLCSSCNSSKKDKTMDFRKGEVTQTRMF